MKGFRSPIPMCVCVQGKEGDCFPYQQAILHDTS